MTFEIGQHVGDYEVLQLLGVGGMGHVYRVRNVISDRIEAMKVLLPDLTAERDLAIRFISEIRTLASFDHPHIALLHTAFMADNQLIMMMEFVEGLTLEQRARQSPMTISEICGYVYQALSALSYAHGREVVHRDIKPPNLMLTPHGIIKLMDFGIAKSKVETRQNLTQPGTTLGSLYYMSPEQVRGDAIDARSDLYSVGIMLYELLAGRRPFEADTTFSILNQQLNAAPQPPIELNPQIPRALNDVILHALAKRPGDRYQTADAFRDALRPFCPNQAVAPGQIAIAPSPAVMNAAPGATVTPAAAAALHAVEAVSSATATMPTVVPPPPVPAAPPPSPTPAPIPPPSAFQPVNVPPAAPPNTSTPYYPQPSGKSGNKGLWIATGIAAAILAMIGLAFALPRILHTHAAEGENDQARQQTTTQQTVTPTIDPKPPVTNVPNTASSHATGMVAANGPHLITAHPYNNPAPVNNDLPDSAGAPIEHTGTDSGSAELAEARDHYTDLSSRAQSVDDSLNTLRQQQMAAGYGLRTDMASADNRMRNYLQAADEDLRSSNTEAANLDLTRAEHELNTLEQFLGH